MKHYFTLIAIFLGFMSFAQPSEHEFTKIDEVPAARAETTIQQQQSFEAKMITAFKNGKAEVIATSFNDNVDLSIDGKSDLYSKSQAEQILKTFFADHPVSSFEVIHKGSSGQSDYFIGELTSKGNAVFKVTINSKTLGGVQRITTLTISPD
ncbi:DUF4783 domain-containing protein [Paracrocinitomix mangrovi]|uniref:DUF4783 domain-containing protein n=1 Tax=Paracrocinitomix mangrovi TaxID=2862509 RepID=UPI001C8EAC65|nr:DUF4783 domain-containing protein [Paracrocinitomix mangrovi]UKN01230.1 DUF4783 domain-containing protein [Paracrocinitomix mangrovi]